MSKPMLFIDLDTIHTDAERLLAGRFVMNICEPVTKQKEDGSTKIEWESDRVFYYAEKEFNEQVLKSKQLPVTGALVWGAGSMFNFALHVLKTFDWMRSNIEKFNKTLKESEQIAFKKQGMFYAPIPTVITDKDFSLFKSLNMNVIPTSTAEII